MTRPAGTTESPASRAAAARLATGDVGRAEHRSHKSTGRRGSSLSIPEPGVLELGLDVSSGRGVAQEEGVAHYEETSDTLAANFVRRFFIVAGRSALG